MLTVCFDMPQLNLYGSAVLGGLFIGVATLLAGQRLRSNRSNWELLSEDLSKSGHCHALNKPLTLTRLLQAPSQIKKCHAAVDLHP